MAKYPSCHPNNSVRALKEIQNTREFHVVLYTCELLRKEVLFPLCQLYHALNVNCRRDQFCLWSPSTICCCC